MAEQSYNDDVAQFFELATQQYSEINLVFYLDKCEYSRLTALCVGIKNGHFIARAPIEKIDTHPIIWGTETSGYFTVRDATIIHCHFKTRLARLYNAPPDALYLVFPLPRHIDHDQRRFSRRVIIDEEVADEFVVWHGLMDGGNFEKPPQLRWMALESRHCELAELSANGLRLDFPEKSPILEKLAINDEILLRGDFGLLKKPNYIFVLGNIVRIMKKPDNPEIISVGCHFRSWRKVDAVNSQAWFRADNREGIGMIAQWLSRNFRSVSK